MGGSVKRGRARGGDAVSSPARRKAKADATHTNAGNVVDTEVKRSRESVVASIQLAALRADAHVDVRVDAGVSDGEDAGAPAMKNDQNVRQLKSMLTETVLRGSCHSALLIGPRGCGKSHTLNRVIREIMHGGGSTGGDATRGSIGDSNGFGTHDVCVVRLSGLLIAPESAMVASNQSSTNATEERLALLEVARQLCAHHGVPFSKSASQADNLVFMREMLRECRRVHCSVIFVIEELDVFANRRQTVLYNILDALQSSDVQAAVIGISCRHDVLETLEKRVRSRFSNRRMLFEPLTPAEGAAMLEVMLTAGSGQARGEGGDEAATFVERQRAVSWWNAGITDLFHGDSDASSALQNALFSCLSFRSSQRHVRRLATTAMVMREWECQQQVSALGDDTAASCSPAPILLSAAHIMNAIEMVDGNDVVEGSLSTPSTGNAVLAGARRALSTHNAAGSVNVKVLEVASLSVMQLAVVVSLSRLAGRDVHEATFEEVFAEYCDCQPTQGTGGVDMHSRSVVFSGLEHVMAMELVAVTSMAGTRTSRIFSPSSLMQHASFRLLVTKDDVKEGIERSPVCPQSLRQAFKHEISSK